MNVLRLVREDDLDAIYHLATLAGVGLTTLPADRERLRLKIQHSCRSVAFPPQSPGGESFLFVLEDEPGGQVIGTSAVYTKVGGFQPFWTYEVLQMQRQSRHLGVQQNIRYLQVKRDHDGPSEVGTLFLHPGQRGHSAGRLLSLSRFLFMAEFIAMFESEVVVEFRGWLDEAGESPFWNALGHHFMDMSLAEADRRSSEDKSFIEDLFPHHPIYIPLLPKEAQAVIGEVHPDTRPAVRLLEKEGFRAGNEVDIFEAGPVMRAATRQIRSVADSIRARVGQGVKPDGEGLQRQYLVAAVDSVADFRVCVSELEHDPVTGTARLPAATLAAMDLQEGAAVRFVPFRSEARL